VLLTFGLLSPNKGIEHVLHALPNIVAEFPDVIYIVLGATHPNELRTRGDAYRHGLEAIVEKNQLQNHVIFHNCFVELKKLTEFIGAGGSLHHPLSGRSPDYLGDIGVCVRRGQSRDLDAVLACR